MYLYIIRLLQFKMEGQNQQKSQKPETQQIQNGQNIQNQDNRQSPISSVSKSYSSSNSQQSDSQDQGQSQKSPFRQGDQVKQEEVKKQGGEGQSQRRIRYKYCCKVCKHTDASKKACVCVVPKSQRRTEIGQQGCQTCGCNGCSKQDFISRGEDPEYKPGQKSKYRKKQKQVTEFQARNGCCRKCMKAFSKSNKSCLCQVPQDVRNTKLPSSGCKICGCFGCNPEDKKDPRHRRGSFLSYLASKKQKQREKQRSRSRDKRRKPSARSKSQQSHSREYIDPITMNFFNVEKSILGGMIVNQYRIDPTLLGFGIPQRTYSYIKGKPK